jgi:uncharacterized protein YkwD
MPRFGIALLLVLGYAGFLTADTPAKDTKTFTPSKEEQEVLDLTNKERQAAGLPALKANEKLFKAARAHSANMAKQNELNHTLDGKGPGERLADAGYKPAGWAENCAQGQRTPQEALASWMNSEGHKANILGQHAEIGIGIATSEGGVKYWTQVFANPAN